jgi:peroxiredoxin
MYRCCWLVSFALLAGSSMSRAGEYNSVLNIGDSAPAWTNLPGVDGKEHSLSDLKDKQAVVVVFTCNSCPYAVDYQDRLMAFARKYATPEGKVALVAINVNAVEADRLPAMKKRAEEKSFNFPYLFDESQKIAQDYGARVTPEFFVLNQERKIVYMGAMDDNSDASKAKVNYVDAAVEAALSGKTPQVKETIGIGCQVRWERRKKK